MKINIIPKKTITPVDNNIEFSSGFYLKDNEVTPDTQEEIVIERILPCTKEAKVKITEKDDIQEENDMYSKFKGLDSYSKVTALNKEKTSRGL